MLTQLRAVNDISLGILQDARRSHDHGMALRAIDRVCREIQLRVRLEPEEQQQAVNPLCTAEWIAARGVILKTLEAFPDARQAMVAALGTVEP